MKNFFTLVSILFCFALQAQEAQKASAQRFIEAVINTSEEDYPVISNAQDFQDHTSRRRRYG